jgi:hypothetical protein
MRPRPVANNWEDVPIQANPGGYEMAVFVGTAAPVHRWTRIPVTNRRLRASEARSRAVSSWGMAGVPEGPMPDETIGSEKVEADRRADERFVWSAATVVQTAPGDRAAVMDEPDGGDEGVELDLAAQELDETTGDSPAEHPGDEPPSSPSSDRAVALESDHWRERAIVWRERAMAAELVAKMLQRNLDDLRAHVDDLHVKVEAVAAADAERRAAIASSEPPWRRFARDMYHKYVG